MQLVVNGLSIKSHIRTTHWENYLNNRTTKLVRNAIGDSFSITKNYLLPFLLEALRFLLWCKLKSQRGTEFCPDEFVSSRFVLKFSLDF